MARTALLVLLALACSSGEPLSPEEEIAAVFERFEAAAAARDPGAAADLVSESYRDHRGRDHRTLKALLARYLLGHEAIHVLSRIREIEVGDPPETARAVVVAALTGAPVADEGELETLSADLWRFEVELALEEDAWRVTRARWRHARPGEFF